MSRFDADPCLVIETRHPLPANLGVDPETPVTIDVATTRE
jgi:hypothetical protein